MQRASIGELTALRRGVQARAPQQLQSGLALLAKTITPAAPGSDTPLVPLPEMPRPGARSRFSLPPSTTASAAAGAPVSRGQGAARGVDYTPEQADIIKDRSRILVANAFAGTGKTTTAVGYAAARPDSRILYMAFNKAIQTEAQSRFARNTRCQTTHSLAYQALGRHYSERICRSWRAMTVSREAGLRTWQQAALTHSTLNKFFQSADSHIGPSHAEAARAQFGCEDADLAIALSAARSLWARMQDRNDRVSIPDDAYLKMWALSQPRLDYDVIIFDEAQDSNPVTAQIVRAQTHASLLYIGDRHQSIYGFRGACNAMDDFGPAAVHRHLSHTWRFGPETAGYANLLLSELKGEKVPLVGLGRDEPFAPGACVTKLSRTNAQLFKDAALVHGHGIHWVGGIESYQVSRVLDAYALFMRSRDQIRDPFLRNFASWGEMRAYTEATKDSETRILADLIDEYKHETPDLVAQMRSNAVPDARDAQMVLTTAHKSKGLDWDYVQIADDFEVLTDAEASLRDDPGAPLDEQEINLLYVAVTRARKAVQLNEETKHWMRDLPIHRKERELARQRLERLEQAHPRAAPGH
ncbi:MAG TPA: UvrD-helicase domain-containing protein [Xanthomonadales bacterium]|nr:UvrD-helicase domain-containing protein [Xanthomonadales bacterium]